MSGDAIVTTSGTYSTLGSQPLHLKIMYEDAIQVAFPKRNPLFEIISKNGKKFTGSRKEFRVESEEGGNYVAVAETGYARAPSKMLTFCDVLCLSLRPGGGAERNGVAR